MKNLIILTICTSLAFGQVNGRSGYNFKYHNNNANYYNQTKPKNATLQTKYKPMPNKDIRYRNCTGCSQKFVYWYNKCLEMRSIKYVAPLKSGTFINYKMSMKCNDEAYKIANTPDNPQIAKKRREEFNNLEYRANKKKKINIIVTDKK